MFVDTNVLVYARDSSDGDKQRMAEAWLRWLWSSGHGRVSMQVLQEFYVTVTQTLRPGMDRAAARDDVRDLMQWRPVETDRALLEAAWTLQDRHGLHWWDAPIVAAAETAGCPYLLSEDFQDQAELGAVTVVSPFQHAPDSFRSH